MRLPFPTRFSVQKMFIFATLVFVVQTMEHTNIFFSMLFFAFFMLSVLTFNLAKGFSRASGAYVFWFATLTCILGVLWKIVLNEPGDSNLVSPLATMGAYVVSMAMLFASIFISHKIVRHPRGVSTLLRADNVNLGLASLGCLLVNQLTVYANDYMSHGSGTIVNALNQINVFLPVCVLLGTVHTIRKTGGQRSMNVVTVIASLIMFVTGGLLYYSKQGMFTWIVCWGAAAASQQYRLRPWQVGVLAGFAIYSVMVLSPLSQVGRAIVPEGADNWQRAELTTDLLMHPIRLRATYENELAPEGTYSPASTGFSPSYFNSPQGLLDRLNMIQVDDRLVTFTQQGHQDGYQRYFYYFINLIPHFIFPNKDSFAPPGGINPGNYYAHEMGTMVTESDYSTGISFSPTAEAFHLKGWVGLVLLLPATWILLFVTVDFVCGDLRRSPYGLLAVVAFAHLAPESLLGALILFVWLGNLAIVVVTVFCAYFAPVLGALLSGPSDSRSALADFERPPQPTLSA